MLPPDPYFVRESFVARLARPGDVPAVCAFYVRNAEHLAPTSPRRPPEFESEEFWAARIEAGLRSFAEGRGATLTLFHADGRMLGFANLMNVVRGALQSCDLGYALDQQQEGRGIMTWLAGCALQYAFGPLRLHRVQANHLPDNERSARVLARLGFRREGYAQAFLLIDGRWRDHVLNAITNPDWRPEGQDTFMLDAS